MTIENCPFCDAPCYKYGEVLSRVVCSDSRCDYRSGITSDDDVIPAHNRVARAASVMPKLLAAARQTLKQLNAYQTDWNNDDDNGWAQVDNAFDIISAAISEATGEDPCTK